MHGIDLKTQMDIVYHALNGTYKGIIDASCCGAFKRKSVEEARDLIEDLAKCNMNPVRSPLFFLFSFLLRNLSKCFLDRVSVVHVNLGSQRETPTSQNCIP